MNGIVFKDDSQITSLFVEKKYGTEDRIIISIFGNALKKNTGHLF